MLALWLAPDFPSTEFCVQKLDYYYKIYSDKKKCSNIENTYDDDDDDNDDIQGTNCADNFLSYNASLLLYHDCILSIFSFLLSAACCTFAQRFLFFVSVFKNTFISPVSQHKHTSVKSQTENANIKTTKLELKRLDCTVNDSKPYLTQNESFSRKKLLVTPPQRKKLYYKEYHISCYTASQ